jgi:hypothetical protein
MHAHIVQWFAAKRTDQVVVLGTSWSFAWLCTTAKCKEME